MAQRSTSKSTNEPCLFCGWTEDVEGFRKSKEGKPRWLMQNKHFFALLDRYPMVTGHTLVVAKRHSKDITEVRDNEAKSLGHILVKIAKLLKESLSAEKVYIMTMCEHWKPEEIDPKWEENQKMPNTTEHLHFHLLPRYKEMRTKEIAQESMFARPQDYGCTLEMLSLVRKMINARANFKHTEKTMKHN